jgi:hypothetical protein
MTDEPLVPWKEIAAQMDISTNDDGLVEGYLSECEDKNRSLEWSLSEATKENERLNAVHHADQYTLTLQARENERLRAALRTIGSASDWHPDDMQAFARASCQT